MSQPLRSASVSRLEKIAEILKVDVDTFFRTAPNPSHSVASLDSLQAFIETEAGSRLLAFAASIDDEALRRRFIELLLSIASRPTQ